MRIWIVGEGSSNRNVNTGESVKTAEESVETRYEFTEAGENTAIML